MLGGVESEEMARLLQQLDDLVARWPNLEFPGWTAEKVVKEIVSAGISISPGDLRELIAERLPEKFKRKYFEFLRFEGAKSDELLF
jgi:hypothetical protein